MLPTPAVKMTPCYVSHVQESRVRSGVTFVAAATGSFRQLPDGTMLMEFTAPVVPAANGSPARRQLATGPTIPIGAHG
jgi:hypothetical protein